MNIIEIFNLAEKPLEDYHKGLRPGKKDKNTNGTIKKHFLRMCEVAKLLIIESSSSLRKHKTYGTYGAFSVSSSNLYGGSAKYGIWKVGLLGKPLGIKFQTIMQERNVFRIDSSVASNFAPSSIDPMKGHTTKAWWITSETSNAVQKFRQSFHIHKKNKKPINHNDQAIKDLMEDGTPRKSKVQLPLWIRVDTKKMIDTYNICIRDKPIAREKKDNNQIRKLGMNKVDVDRLWNLYAIAEIHNGYLPQEYEEKEFGRLYGNSFYSLQLIPNRMLPYIIPNSFDYDLEACHPTLLVQMAKKVASNTKTPYLDKYLHNRKKIRQKIAMEIGSDEERIKQAINSIAYGAPLRIGEWFNQKDNKHNKTALLKHLGELCGNKFIINKNVVALYKEMDECKKIILNHPSYVINIPSGLKKNQKLSYVLQQKERKLLEIMIVEIQKQNIEIIALKHDGIIIKKKMNKSIVEKSIIKKTGFQMAIDKKRIG